jgi:hypothetical protein
MVLLLLWQHPPTATLLVCIPFPLLAQHKQLPDGTPCRCTAAPCPPPPPPPPPPPTPALCHNLLLVRSHGSNPCMAQTAYLIQMCLNLRESARSKDQWVSSSSSRILASSQPDVVVVVGKANSAGETELLASRVKPSR